MSGLQPGLLLPAQRLGALPALIAATSFLLVLAAAASLTLGRTAQAIARAATGTISIVIVDPDGPRRAAAAAKALATLRALPDVAAARPVEEAEIARLVAPYLGAGGLGDLPLPALIDVRLKAGGHADALAKALAPIATAHVSAEGESLRPLARLIGALRGVALAIMALAALATGLVAVLVARGAIEAHGDAVATLHSLGATDRQLAGLLQRRIGRDAGVGGAAGLVLAAAAILLVEARAAALGGGAIEGGGVGPSGWVVLVLLPALLAGLAILATRVAILRRLTERP